MASYQTMANSEYLEVEARETEHRVLTSGLKKGNNPDRRLRSLI